MQVEAYFGYVGKRVTGCLPEKRNFGSRMFGAIGMRQFRAVLGDGSVIPIKGVSRFNKPSIRPICLKHRIHIYDCMP